MGIRNGRDALVASVRTPLGRAGARLSHAPFILGQYSNMPWWANVTLWKQNEVVWFT